MGQYTVKDSRKWTASTYGRLDKSRLNSPLSRILPVSRPYKEKANQLSRVATVKHTRVNVTR